MSTPDYPLLPVDEFTQLAGGRRDIEYLKRRATKRGLEWASATCDSGVHVGGTHLFDFGDAELETNAPHVFQGIRAAPGFASPPGIEVESLDSAYLILAGVQIHTPIQQGKHDLYLNVLPSGAGGSGSAIGSLFTMLGFGKVKSPGAGEGTQALTLVDFGAGDFNRFDQVPQTFIVGLGYDLTDGAFGQGYDSASLVVIRVGRYFGPSQQEVTD